MIVTAREIKYALPPPPQPYEILVISTDSLNSLDILLNTVGVLTVDGQQITSGQQTIVTDNPFVDVKYQLTRGIGKARQVFINDVDSGMVKNDLEMVSLSIESQSSIFVKFVGA